MLMTLKEKSTLKKTGRPEKGGRFFWFL